MKVEEMSPVELRDNIWVKREDLFSIHNQKGSKARAAYYLISKLVLKGYKTLVMPVNTNSSTYKMVSNLCESLHVNLECFVPSGVHLDLEGKSFTKVFVNGISYSLPETIGYSKVYAELYNLGYIPYELKCPEAVDILSRQVSNIPKQVKRVVVPCWTGITYASVASGLLREGRVDVSLLGIYPSINPIRTVQELCPDIRYLSNRLVESNNYIEYLEDGDCLWLSK